MFYSAKSFVSIHPNLKDARRIPAASSNPSPVSLHSKSQFAAGLNDLILEGGSS